MSRAATLALALMPLAACVASSLADPELLPPPPHTPTSVVEAPPPAALETCVDPSPPVPIDVDLLERVTLDRGIRWYRATKRGATGLTWLRADGSLGFVELPQNPNPSLDEASGWNLCAPEGEGQIRCFDGPSRRRNGTWRPLRSVAISLADAPTLGPLTHWPDAPSDRLIAAASEGQHALLVFDDIRWPEPEYARHWNDDPSYRAARLERWDVNTGRPTDPEAALLEGWVEPMAAWCGATSCTFVARHQDGLSYRPDERGPTNIVAVTTPGPRVQILAKDVADDGVVFEHPVILAVEGSHVVVTRRDERLSLVALDGEGEIRGQTKLKIESGGDYAALGEGLLGYRRGWDRTQHDWELLTISAEAEVTQRGAISSSAVGLQAARVAGGIIVAGLTGEVSYDEVGDYAFHSWIFEADQRFIHPKQGTDWSTLLGEATPSVGDGRGGYDLEWLTRPDRAAALLWPTGDAWAEPQLIPVRVPCRAE